VDVRPDVVMIAGAAVVGVGAGVVVGAAEQAASETAIASKAVVRVVLLTVPGAYMLPELSDLTHRVIKQADLGVPTS
jgi:hypothetical protein